MGADVTYPELLNRRNVQAVCNNLNYRHKMAQYAQRASVALHTHLFFKQRVQDEDAYVLSVRQNALQVLIPKFGLEGSIYLNAKDDKASAPSGPTFVYNPDVRIINLSFITRRGPRFPPGPVWEAFGTVLVSTLISFVI